MQSSRGYTKFNVTTDSGRTLTVEVASGEVCSASEIAADLKGDLRVEVAIESASLSLLSGYTSTPFRNTLRFAVLWLIVLIIGFFAIMMADLFIHVAKLGDGITPGHLQFMARGWLYLLAIGVIIYLAPALLRFKRRS